LRADSGSSALRLVVQPLCLARCQAQTRQQQVAVLSVPQITWLVHHDRRNGS